MAELTALVLMGRIISRWWYMWWTSAGDITINANHGAGIFTYRTGWFWTRANVGIRIPAPWVAYGIGSYCNYLWRVLWSQHRNPHGSLPDGTSLVPPVVSQNLTRLEGMFNPHKTLRVGVQLGPGSSWDLSGFMSLASWSGGSKDHKDAALADIWVPPS